MWKWVLCFASLVVVIFSDATLSAERAPLEFRLACIMNHRADQSDTDYDTRIAACTAALKAEPEDNVFLSRRGVTYMRRNGDGDANRAIADLTKAIAISTKNDGFMIAYYYLYRGQAYKNLENCTSAVRDFDKAIALFRDHDIGAYYWRGLCLLDMKQYNRAIADLSRAIKTDLNDPYAYHYRGLAKQGKGDTKGAAADFARAKALGYTE